MIDQLAGFFGGSGSLVIVLVIFVIFLFVAFKVLKVVVKAIIIAVVAAAFPFIARYIFGMEIPTTIDSILWFVITALGLYFIYAFIRGGYKLANFAFGGRGKKK